MPGCYAQKPLKAIQRIIKSGSRPKDLVVDFFSHSGTTLVAAEIEGRTCYTVDIEELRSKAEFEALNTGLAKTSDRVKLLKRIAEKLEKDLFEDDLFWTDEVKGVGSGPIAQIVDYEEFNSAEVAQLRGVLDDIAKETGGRVQKIDQKTEHSGEVAVIDNDRFDRAISTLADAVREVVPGKGSESDSSVGASE